MMLVGQAAYGERNSGHAMLGASPSADMATELTNEMDLRGSPPPGTIWTPYFTGFSHRTHYVLARTAPDVHASRAGMVRSRALFIPIDALTEWDSIGHALSFLVDDFDTQGSYQDVDIATEGAVGSPHYGLASALAEVKEGTIIWADDIGFQAAIANLWHHLWPHARAALSFRMAFSPQDVPDRPTIATTMSQLKARWTGFPIVKDNVTQLDRAGAVLAGAEDGTALRKLIDALNARVKSFNQLHQFVDILEVLEGDAEFPETIAAVRLTGHLSPQPSDGVEEKARLIDKSTAKLIKADVGEVRTSRNLSLAAFQKANDFWKALEDWASTELWKKTPEDIGRIIRDVSDEGPTEIWRNHTSKGMRSFLKKETHAAPAIWRVLEGTPDLLSPIAKLATNIDAFDKALATTSPRALSHTIAEALLNHAGQLGLPELHAVCCSLGFAPEKSIEVHLKVKSATARSIALALSHATAEQIALAAVNSSDERVIDLAVNRAALATSALRGIDVDNPTWRGLWRLTLAKNPTALNAPRDARRCYFRLLDLLIDGVLTEDDLELIRKLANTGLAEISTYPRREDVWASLPGTMRSKIATATANTWLTEFLEGKHGPAPERTLSDAIIALAQEAPHLAKLVANPLTGLEFFRTFPNVAESAFIEWLKLALRSAVSKDIATAIGAFIATRSWSTSASFLADQALAGRNDVEPALEYCRDLLGYFTRFWLGILGPTADSVKWRVLEDIGADLFPMGPGDKSLWQRAGGKAADIPNAPSGREAWHTVVTDMEKGGKRMKARDLLNAMLSEFPDNRVLQKLRQEHFRW
ncbi:effector-associated domain EAD1-containing protein [Sinorhizobium terangae]|uniref:GAP1-N1 domain-containing protein n=1 Tax=Sinorhizobium terangae TaxID=110322 RepID=UPI0031FD6648